MQRSELTDNYLQALGLNKQEPGIGFLSAIVHRHVARFAFSSVGPLLGNELSLETAALFERIVIAKRGGYCFEQNGLMYAMLENLGFSTKLYLARVIYNKDIHPPLTHRINTVKINDTRYIVDVGFGPLGPGLPVELSTRTTVDSYRTFRVDEPQPGIFHMQTLREDGFFSLYKFELAQYGQADCELGHFWSHQHPHASFVNNLVISVIEDDEVRSIRNREFCVETAQGNHKNLIESSRQLEALLKHKFDIDVTTAEAQQLFDKSGQ